MSQRSAFSAAASATAEVSDPPRPRVAMRSSGPMPWKPATTATWPCRMDSASAPPSIDWIRALACASSVRSGNCQPCQERASTPILRRAMASRPLVTCSPVATTVSYSRGSCNSSSAWHQATSWLVVPDMADTTTATSFPASTSRFTRWATVRIRSRSATEVPPNFITIRGIGPRRCAWGAGWSGSCAVDTGEASEGQPWVMERR